MNLTKAAKIVRVSNAVAAGTGDVNGSSVDMKGFHSVTFVALLGTVASTGVPSLKAQQSSDDGSSDAFADLTGTSVAGDDTDDNKMLVLEVPHPRERYVRPVVGRATANVTVDGVLAILTEPDFEPITEDSSIAGSEIHHAPAEGTA